MPFANSSSTSTEAGAVNEAYCATTSGVGADPAGPVTEADFFAAFLTGALTAFAVADFLGAAIWTATFFVAFLGAVFATAFFTAAFLAATDSCAAAAALFAAHR